jgi:hypothetical protein
LAVGLFGEWGQGKSHFLRLVQVQRQVAVAARSDNPLAHSAVRQVEFNAWHYAETDLWPSLVAEMFTQLATPPDAGTELDGDTERRRWARRQAEQVAEQSSGSSWWPPAASVTGCARSCASRMNGATVCRPRSGGTCTC